MCSETCVRVTRRRANSAAGFVRARARIHLFIHSFIHYSFARALAPCKIYELVHYAIPFFTTLRRAARVD